MKFKFFYVYREHHHFHAGQWLWSSMGNFHVRPLPVPGWLYKVLHRYVRS